MPITILSPHSGKPVKIRDQDVGRAVRDEEKRVFYALERPGGGHYAALTRNGSQKDLERYEALESKTAAGAVHVQEVAAAHDARGPGRRGGGLRLLVILALLLALAVGAWFGYRTLTGGGLLPAGLPEPRVPVDLLPSPSPTPPAPAGWFLVPAAAAEEPVRHARAGDYAVVRYELARLDGTVIDATNPLRPLGFVLWSGAAFRGLDATVAGMAVGEVKEVQLPAAEVDPDLAAARGSTGTLRLTVELVDVLAGVEKTVLREGDRDALAAGPGDRLTLNWSVRLDGRAEPVVTTEQTGGPATLVLGAGTLVQGLEQGLAGMRPGEVADFEVPPHLAYGDAGIAGGLVPPGSPLRVRVELIAVEPGR